MNLEIATPRWALPLLEPKRYKGIKGGRGCVHPDTLIDTPSGQIKISEFNGGKVYSWRDGDLVISNASPAIECSEEDLFEVELECGRKIVATDEHKFLTSTGWVELSFLSMSDEVVVSQYQETFFPLHSSSDTFQHELTSNVYHSRKIREDYPACYFLYHHQYGQQLQLAIDSVLFFSQPQVYGRPHSYHASYHLDVQEFFYKDNLSFPLFLLSTSAVLPSLNSLYYVGKENCIGEKTFEQPLALFQPFQLFHKTKNLVLPFHKLQGQYFYFEIWRNQAQSLQMQLDKNLSFVRDNFSYYIPVKNNAFIVSKIRHITKHSRLKYWDLHVFGTNNYLSNGIVNHNSGKSHFVGESRIEDLIINHDHCGVCIREFQKSTKFSSKKLLEDKIKSLGVSHLFKVMDKEIRRIGGSGFIIFEGMNDHNSESIKSLEGFNWAWVEEAQCLSANSLEMLTPTIRAEKSEIYFTWNPKHKTDAVDKFFSDEHRPDNAIVVHVNYDQNPFLPTPLKIEAKQMMERDPDLYRHIWLGEYDEKSEERVFSKNWCIREFDIDYTFGQPIQGLDFGFSQDPTAAIRAYIKNKCLYISHEAGKIGLELDETIPYLKARMPEFEKYPTYGDSSRPESISYLKRAGLSRIKPCRKWPGSVEDGITYLKSFDEIIIHPRCKETINEFHLYSFKVDKNTGEITSKILDRYNHYIDALRYANDKAIQRGKPIDYKKLI